MQRALRFRVWDGRRMWQPEEVIAFRFYGDGLFGVEVWADVLDGEPWDAPHTLQGDLTPLQATGLTDADGREIFEGDVVEAQVYREPMRFTVYWNEDAAGFSVRSPLGPPDQSAWPLMETARVVGHVYEGEPSADPR